MKKVIMMFAVIAMAIGAQAETVMWQVFDSDAMGIYLVNGSNGQELGAAFGMWLSLSDRLTSELQASTWDTQLQDLQNSLTAFDDSGEGWFGHDADYDDTYFAFLVTYDDANLTPGGSFKAYIADNTYHEDTFDLSEMTPSLSLIYSGNFGGEAIPEPTSGLLLLLGMAGLALKRSRLR